MKLQCQVDVINRTHAGLNIRFNPKYVKSTLALGKEPKCDTDFFIIHFSSSNKNGTKYKVKFIKQLFVRCINEGKASIRFENPPHDLCIKSETLQLKCFMKLLQSCIKGDLKNLPISSLSNISVTHKDIAPKKLVIHNRSEFPKTGFPRTLESLHMSGLKLCNFRRDILLLKQLVILDLSNNEIEKIPIEFGRMPCLNELYLANNQLGAKEVIDWKWLLGPQITKKLKLLDLSGNKLQHLPKAIWQLQSLVTLKLDDNKLQKLPSTLGRISTLRYLTISKNELQNLPCSLLQCRLEYIDITSNNFMRSNDVQKELHTNWDFCIQNLVHISAKIVLKNKFHYAPNIIPWTLVNMLDNANICICGQPVLNKYNIYKRFALKDYFREVVFNNNMGGSVDIECYVCSCKCLKTLKYSIC